MDIVDEELLTRLAKVNKVEQILNASNAVYLLSLDGDDKYVFKPSLGERPLWDFQSGSLYLREYLTSIVFTFMGIKVPRSYLLNDSPLGAGLLMDFIEWNNADLAMIHPKNTKLDKTWLSAMSGVTTSEEEVTLWHKDIDELRLIALGDLIVNNADRKINHIVCTASGLVALDHGLTFHHEPKLRTFLWGWQGKNFHQSELDILMNLLSFLEKNQFTYLISDREYTQLLERLTGLLSNPEFPSPPIDRPPLPWPVY